MKQYIPVGAVNRELDRRRAQERKEKLLCRLADITTGMMIGVLLGLAICILR